MKIRKNFLFGVLLSLLTTACDLLGHDGSNINIPPPAANVSGIWMISGRGQREDCTDKSTNEAFSLASSMSLSVAQAVGNNAPDTLFLAKDLDLPAEVTFIFSGQVDGQTVNFSTDERQVDDKQVEIYKLMFNYTGTVAGKTISGSLNGLGPETCTSNGNFEVNIERDDE